LWATGDVRLWVELNLLLKDNAGDWHPESFRVDSATDITTFPAHFARQLNLPMPIKASSGATHTQTGLEVRSGLLRFRIDGMDATEYAVSCFFLGDPQISPSGNPAALPRKLLQPLALLDRLRFHFDKNATVAAPQGEMMVAKK
jgi:hypothetical protein